MKTHNPFNKSSFLPAVVALLVFTNTTFAQEKSEAPVFNDNITMEQITAAQKGWGAALIAISAAYREGGIEKARPLAKTVLETAYAYQMGPVLFKPTLTVSPQTFRITEESALAYFVGHNEKFPNDKGFALNPWVKYDFENAAVFISGDTAQTMGKVYLTNDKGEVTEVDKTWGFKKDSSGNLRIYLHHSSLPYSQPKQEK